MDTIIGTNKSIEIFFLFIDTTIGHVMISKSSKDIGLCFVGNLKSFLNFIEVIPFTSIGFFEWIDIVTTQNQCFNWVSFYPFKDMFIVICIGIVPTPYK